MRTRTTTRTVHGAAAGASLLCAGLALACHATEAARETRAPRGETARVQLCDGECEVEVELEDGMTSADGQRISDELMAQWRLRNPGATWEVADVHERHAIVPPADNSDLVATEGQGEGHVYGRITPLDVALWGSEVEEEVAAGARVFHDAAELGSTIAVSCDMCHPDAANTHPETYPKYQVQLGRVALLRDMINWCLEHPVRGTPLAPDDPRMRAMEAYILAQRKGTPLNYGRR